MIVMCMQRHAWHYAVSVFAGDVADHVSRQHGVACRRVQLMRNACRKGTERFRFFGLNQLFHQCEQLRVGCSQRLARHGKVHLRMHTGEHFFGLEWFCHVVHRTGPEGAELVLDFVQRADEDDRDVLFFLSALSRWQVL